VADTSTERSRRLRAHRRGEHASCRPESCSVAAARQAQRAVPHADAGEPPEPPFPLGEHGLALWHQVLAEFDLGSNELAQLAEACSIFDFLRACDERIAREGLMVRGRYSGSGVAHPLLKAQNDKQRTFALYMAQLGLTEVRLEWQRGRTRTLPPGVTPLEPRSAGRG
jgi:hypothetical protein